MPQAHRMATAVPGIEIADDRDTRGIRRPHRKSHPGDAVDRHKLRAEGLGHLEMAAFVE